MCMCGNGDATLSPRAKNNYYFQKKQRLLLLQEQSSNCADATLDTETPEAAQTSSAGLLRARTTTCIFCHWMKRCEQPRVATNATNSSLGRGKQVRSPSVAPSAAKSKRPASKGKAQGQQPEGSFQFLAKVGF